MPDLQFQFASQSDGLVVTVYAWRCPNPRALVLIAHGAAEHALRYERFARALNAAGIDVFAPDHRGHGASAGPEGLGDFGAGGWDALIADLHQVLALAKGRTPGVPALLMGHSMGAMAAQQWVPEGSGDIAALILSGTTAREIPPDDAPPPVFEPNSAFENPRTAYDWLSRDDAEVDKYINDPLCGFEALGDRRGSFRPDPRTLADPERLRRIRPDLPVLLVAGDMDPINRRLEGLQLLEARLGDAGVVQIDTQYYPGGRHEMLNEINRDEVTANIIAWIDSVLPLSAAAAAVRATRHTG